MRSFFAEGDLLVAEVRELFADASASLHTRSLKYGKLRNGAFLPLAGMGGSGGRRGGVARSRRQLFTMQTSRGGGEIDVILGVNGYVWIAKHVKADDEKETNITRLEESASQAMYSSQNEEIGVQTRREIARIAGVIKALAEGGRRVDEDMVVKGYEASLEVDMDAGEQDDNVGSEWMGGERGRRVVEAVVG